MANFKESSGYCPHCQKRVVGRREEADHTFWLIGTIFSCGLFAVIWAISSIIKAGEPFRCSICGTPLQATPATGNFSRSNAPFGAASSNKNTSKPFLLVGAALVGLVVLASAIIFFINFQRLRTAESVRNSNYKENILPPPNKAVASDGATEEHVIELRPFVTQLSDEKPRYIKVAVSLRVRENPDEVEKNNPKFIPSIRDAMLTILSAKKSDDVVNLKGKTRLRQELLNAAQSVTNNQVEELFITDIIVQL